MTYCRHLDLDHQGETASIVTQRVVHCLAFFSQESKVAPYLSPSVYSCGNMIQIIISSVYSSRVREC